MARKQHKTAPKVGGFSTLNRIMKADGRTHIAKLLKEVRASLAEHLGGAPTAAEAILVHSVSIKVVRLALLDERVLSDLESDKHQWLSWSNSVRRDLEVLGLRPEGKGGPRLRELLGG